MPAVALPHRTALRARRKNFEISWFSDHPHHSMAAPPRFC
jgi:hypothetical protein